MHIPRKSVSTKIAARQPRSARPPLHFEVVQGHVLSGLWWERGPSGCVARSAAPPAAARFVPISCLWLQRVARRWRTGHFAFPVVNLMYMCVSVWFGAQVARTAGAACLRKLVAGGRLPSGASQAASAVAQTPQLCSKCIVSMGHVGCVGRRQCRCRRACRADASVRQCPACPPWHQHARRGPYAVPSGSLDPHHVCLQPPQGVLCTCKLRHARCFLSVSRRAPVTCVVVVWLCRGATLVLLRSTSGTAHHTTTCP